MRRHLNCLATIRFFRLSGGLFYRKNLGWAASADTSGFHVSRAADSEKYVAVAAEAAATAVTLATAAEIAAVASTAVEVVAVGLMKAGLKRNRRKGRHRLQQNQ